MSLGGRVPRSSSSSSQAFLWKSTRQFSPSLSYKRPSRRNLSYTSDFSCKRCLELATDFASAAICSWSRFTRSSIPRLTRPRNTSTGPFFQKPKKKQEWEDLLVLWERVGGVYSVSFGGRFASFELLLFLKNTCSYINKCTSWHPFNWSFILWQNGRLCQPTKTHACVSCVCGVWQKKQKKVCFSATSKKTNWHNFCSNNFEPNQQKSNTPKHCQKNQRTDKECFFFWRHKEYVNKLWGYFCVKTKANVFVTQCNSFLFSLIIEWHLSSSALFCWVKSFWSRNILTSSCKKQKSPNENENKHWQCSIHFLYFGQEQRFFGKVSNTTQHSHKRWQTKRGPKRRQKRSLPVTMLAKKRLIR